MKNDKGVWRRPEMVPGKSPKWICSACGEIAYYPQIGPRGRLHSCKYPYCPWCGTVMDVSIN